MTARDAFERHLRAADSRDLTPRRDACEARQYAAARIDIMVSAAQAALQRRDR